MKINKIRHSVIVTVILTSMFLFSWFAIKHAEKDKRSELLAQTVFGANSLDIKQIKNLTATSADLQSQDYQSLKRQFSNMLKTDEDFHFIYLMGVKPNGKVFFYVDDKPDGTKEYSPPGSAYDEVPREFNMVMKTGIPVVQGPSADSWGNFTSGCAPVIDPKTGKPIAIFAIDFNARDWYWDIATHAVLPVSLIIAFSLGLISFLISIQRGKMLRESESRYHTLFSDSPDSYVIIKNSKIIDCNQATEKSLGCPYIDIIGCSPSEFFPQIQSDGHISRELAVQKENMAMYLGNISFEWIIKRKDGKEFWALVSIKRMKLDNETVIFATWTDISEKKKAEEDLVKAVDAANTANKAKSEFLANMSHEIRTPLNSVIGFTDLLKKTPLTSLQEQYVSNANASGHNLLSIINDILDFSKIEAGMLDLEIITTDLIEILNQSVDIVRLIASQKNLEILLDIDSNLPRFADVDPVRLKQILTNLLSNAVKFTAVGEVGLKVRYEELNSSSGKILFSVHDTGIGIKIEEQIKLFKAFSQADSSTTRKYGGTGLGLVISEMLAKKMGSTISLNSIPGEGAIFTFEIITKTKHGQKPDISALKSVKRCLIIDDNTNARMILEQILSDWGIESVSCENGKIAAETINSLKPFDIIFCDYQMPVLDGLETIKQIQHNSDSTNSKIIMLLSSFEHLDICKECEGLGIKFKLSKPVKSDELYSCLCGIINPTKKNIQDSGVSVQLSDNQEFSSPVSILIAEDNLFNMVLAKAIVSEIFVNARIFEAKNGKEALRYWLKEKPDMILMDLQMPEMSGLEATTEIRKQETTGHKTPIIALTAGVLNDEKELCLNAGMNEFVTKPIDPSKLKEIIIQIYKNRETV